MEPSEEPSALRSCSQQVLADARGRNIAWVQRIDAEWEAELARRRAPILERIANIEAEQARRRAPILERMEEPDAPGSLPQGGWHREAQSEPQLQSRLDRPACTMCVNIWDSLLRKNSSEDCYVIDLGPFWKDVAVPGLHSLASGIVGDDNSIKVCKRCTERLKCICEWQMREIRETRLENRFLTYSDASMQLLDKAHVLILAQLSRQCANLLKHS
jgi:hypothetical protein